MCYYVAGYEKVNRSTIIFKFPQVMPKKATTSLVLKAPKTESSNRTIYLPQAVIDELPLLSFSFRDVLLCCRL